MGAPNLPWYRTPPGIVGIVLGVAAVAVVAVLLLTGGSDDNPTAGTTSDLSSPTVAIAPPTIAPPTIAPPATTTTVAGSDASYSGETITAFMADCGTYMEEGDCTCMVDALEGIVSEEEFNLALSEEELSPVSEAAFQAAFDLCAPAATGEPLGTPYAEETRTEFMDACTPDSGEDFCACTLTEIEKVFTEEEFIQADLAPTDADLALVLEAATACESLLPVQEVTYESCTQDWPGLTIPIPDGWVAYEPAEGDPFPCQFFSRDGFAPLTPETLGDAPLVAFVSTEESYYEYIASIVNEPVIEEIAMDGYTGWRWVISYESGNGTPKQMLVYILPVWPDDPTFPLFLQITGQPDTRTWRKAEAALEWILETIVIPPTGQ